MPKQECEICFRNLQQETFIWVSCETCQNTVCSNCFVEMKNRAKGLSAKCPFCRTLYAPEINRREKELYHRRYNVIYLNLVEVAHSFLSGIRNGNTKRLELGIGYVNTVAPIPPLLFRSTPIEFSPGVHLMKHSNMWRDSTVFALSSDPAIMPFLVQIQTIQYHYAPSPSDDQEEFQDVYEDVMETLLDYTEDMMANPQVVITLSCASIIP